MPESNLDTIADVYRAFDSRYFTVIERFFDPAIVINQSPELPWGGVHRGHGGAVAFSTQLLRHVDSQAVTERLFAAGDDVVVQVGRTKGKAIASGMTFEIPEVHVWRLCAGRVVGFEAYIDTPAMLKALVADQ
jgi:uncharacterized protein